MDLRDSFERLNTLRVRLGAREDAINFDRELEPLKEIEIRLEADGIEVAREDIVAVGPFLTYKGEILAILYILNSTSPRENLVGNFAGMKGTPKFHFAWCDTLNDMTQQKRFNRYVLSRSKENLFRVEAMERENDQIILYGERHFLEDIRLYPCQNCLAKLEYHGFTYSKAVMSWEERMTAVDDYSIREYLDENDGNLAVMKFIPEHTANTAPGGGYTSDFPKISKQLRERAKWMCSNSKCNVDMSGKKNGLHVHHISGVKSDNNESNLVVLCALCHRDVDEFHKTMHVSKEIQRFILSRR